MIQGRLLLAITTACLLMQGCLRTRGDVGDTNDRQEVGNQTSNNQRAERNRNNSQNTAAAPAEAAHDAETQELLRQLNGRIELLEARLKEKENTQDPERQALQQQLQDSQGRVQLLQEEVTKLQTSVSKMQSDAATVPKAFEQEAAKPGAKGKGKNDPKTKTDSYDAGQKFFAAKDWKQAIINYQKYRETNTKGVYYPEATYKIGVSFQELGMKEEAKTFYEDVTSNYPKSEAARKSRARLKSIK